MVRVIHWREAPPWPPVSNIRGSSKICRPPMVEVITTKMMVGGRSIGTVTCQKRAMRSVPSMIAAS